MRDSPLPQHESEDSTIWRGHLARQLFRVGIRVSIQLKNAEQWRRKATVLPYARISSRWWMNNTRLRAMTRSTEVSDSRHDARNKANRCQALLQVIKAGIPANLCQHQGTPCNLCSPRCTRFAQACPPWHGTSCTQDQSRQSVRPHTAVRFRRYARFDCLVLTTGMKALS